MSNIFKGLSESSLADQMLALARQKNPNARLAGTPEQERERTQKMLAQRQRDREDQERQIGLQDFENIDQLKNEYAEMRKRYEALGGSNWQYADREQNLTDREREARSMEPALNQLGSRIARAEKYGNVSEGKKDDEADYGDEYQDMVKRVGQMAKEGPRKVVYDPVTRKYKTVPVKQPAIKQGVDEAKADPTSTWVVYDGDKVKRFKTHQGAKAYAEQHGGKVASSAHYADKIQGKQGVAEAAGLYGPFTVTINTGERPQSRTKTKKFRREDDAILWAEDWLEDFPQYSFATAEVTDPEGNVVWSTDEQGVAEGATVTRIDSKPITDFASNLKAYKHTDDWSQSGIDTGDDSYWTKKKLKVNTTKGLFAGEPHRTALYATGNAHETRYVEFTQDGQPIVYFDKKDLPAMRSRKTYLTVFDASNFRQLPTGEWFSENPGKPIKQTEIGDPFKYIADQGWIVRITDDLNKVFKQVKKMHRAGKISHYGAEGMNESKQGVAEGRENYNGLNLLLQKDDEELFVKASAGGRELGHVLFVIDGDTLSPQDLEVDERYRGQGIAKTMYDYVKSKGYKIRRSGQQTDAGKGFWAKHRPEQNVWEQGVAEGTDDKEYRNWNEYEYELQQKAGKALEYLHEINPDMFKQYGDEFLMNLANKISVEFPTASIMQVAGGVVRQLKQNVDEGQIYMGGNKPAGMRWYKPRSVPNEDELARKESAIMKGLQVEGNDEEHQTGGSLGTPYPTTYEQETLPYRTKGQRRTQSIAFEDKDE